jgi:hypothetical protein
MAFVHRLPPYKTKGEHSSMTKAYTKAGVLGEINNALDNKLMTAEQLLDELLGAMTADELKENWKYIKRNWETFKRMEEDKA